MHTARRHAIGLGLLLGIVSCDTGPVEVCTNELTVRLTPRDAALVVGQSLTPDARFLTCGGRERLSLPTNFVSDQPAIVSVSADGLTLRAEAPGSARVSLNGGEYGSGGDIVLTVTAAP